MRFSRSFSLCLLIPALGFRVQAAPPRDARYLSERMEVERARHLHDIEGDAPGAHRIVDRLLMASANPEIRTHATYLRGSWSEIEGRTAEAVEAYISALNGHGLSLAEKKRLVARLRILNPSAIQPLQFAGTARGKPTRVFTSPVAAAGSGNTRYVLLEQPPGNGQEGPGSAPVLEWQDEKGLLHSLEAPLAPGEEVLDATPDILLTFIPDREQAFLRKAPEFLPVPAPDKFAAVGAVLFSGEPDEFLLMGNSGLRVMRREKTVFSFALPGPGCEYLPSAPRARRGTLFCPAQGLYQADFVRKALVPIQVGGEPPLGTSRSGDYLALRRSDRVEIRRGPGFENVLWTLPADAQDQLALGRDLAFLTGNQGQLRAYSLRTGQLEWLVEGGVASAQPFGNLVYTHSFDGIYQALDTEGRIVFTYGAGWGQETSLLPSADWVVLHRADGVRTRLDLELLRIIGPDRSFLLQPAREFSRRRDWKQALAAWSEVLALEPGNGEAWKEKSQALRALGGSRKLLNESHLQAARSRAVEPWTADPALRTLAHSMGATWVWKRSQGPRFFPTLVTGRRFSFYAENDNRTLLLLDNETGTLAHKFRLPEVLDLKAALWLGDTLVVSSPGRLYLMAPETSTEILAQIPLRDPICQAIAIPEGLAFSDWNGTLRLLEFPSLRIRWERSLGRSGLLLARGRGADPVDVFEIEGGYHSIQISTGRSLATTRLPPGIITECHAGKDFAYAGYNEGLLLAVDRIRGTIAWQKDLGEQIFSLAGRGDQFLLLGMASRRLLTVRGQTGEQTAQTQLSTYLFNRPLLVEDGYWVGTTVPALEKRAFNHALLQQLPLTDMPGTPTVAGNGIAISTLDHFILHFPYR